MSKMCQYCKRELSFDPPVHAHGSPVYKSCDCNMNIDLWTGRIRAAVATGDTQKIWDAMWQFNYAHRQR